MLAGCALKNLIRPIGFEVKRVGRSSGVIPSGRCFGRPGKPKLRS
jgi:hypothetical protein